MKYDDSDWSKEAAEVTEVIVPIGYVTHQQSLRILDALRKVDVRESTISFTLKSLYQMQKFNNAVSLETNRDDQFEQTYIQKSLTALQKKLIYCRKSDRKKTGYKLKVRVDFIFKDKALIFQEVYFEKLKSLQNQYDYEIINTGRILEVYGPGDTPYSQMFRNQILEMKDRLQVFVSFSENYIEKLKYSPLLVKKLQQKGVKFITKTGNNRNYGSIVVFYSISRKYVEMKRIISEILINQITVIKLFNDYWALRKSERPFFELMIASTQNTRARISKINQFNVQMDQRYGAIVLHSRDNTFADIPKKQLENYLANILIIQFSGRTLRRWHNEIKRLAKRSDFLRETSSGKSRNVVIQIRRDRLTFVGQLIELLKGFVKSLNQYSQMRIYIPKPIQKQQILRITALAQDNKLMIVENGREDLNFIKIKLRDLNIQNPNNVLRKQKQVLNFFFRLVIRDFNHEFTNEDLISMEICSQIKSDGPMIDKQIQSKQQKVVSQQDNITQNASFDCIQLNYVQPAISAQVEEQDIFKQASKGPIQKQIRKILEAKHEDLKFQVYPIVYSDQQIIKNLLISIRQSKHFNFQKAFFTKEIKKQNKLLDFSQLQLCNLKQFKQDQVGFIVFLSKKDNHFIATKKFIRL